VVAGSGKGGEEEAAPVEGGERRRRLSDIQSRARRWPKAHGGARHGRPSDDARASGAEVGDEVGGPDQTGLGRADRVATRPKGLFGLKMREKGK
jgi:hypothetical protein